MDNRILKEACRYMGYGSKEPSKEELVRIQDCFGQLEAVSHPRFLYRSFPLSFPLDGSIEAAGCRIKSRNLQKNLTGCHEAVSYTHLGATMRGRKTASIGPAAGFSCSSHPGSPTRIIP